MAKLKSLVIIVKEVIDDLEVEDLFSDDELRKVEVIKNRKKEKHDKICSREIVE